MKLKAKAISLCLLMVFSYCVGKAQEKTGLPASSPAAEEDEIVCGLTRPLLIRISFSAWSSKKGYLKNLTSGDFEVYERNEMQEVDSFIFDESKNRYLIAFYPTRDKADFEKYDVKIKVKLSKQSRKEYGKISVRLLRD